jgi:hypothetical protein
LVSYSKGKPHIRSVGEEDAEEMSGPLRRVKEIVMKNLNLYNLYRILLK